MTTTLTGDIAAIIREVDGDNTMPAADLGWELACRLADAMHDFYVKHDLYADVIMRFVERTNPDKRMGAGRLAELIVTEFELDKEN
jgi:hypothetical protein